MSATAELRERLTGHDQDELLALVRDHFPSVYARLAPWMTRPQQVTLLLDHAERHGLTGWLGQLLDSPQSKAAETDPEIDEAALLLRVSVPRLALKLDRFQTWVGRYTPERHAQAADELQKLAGFEGLALLAALPAPVRSEVLAEQPLDEERRAGLLDLVKRLSRSDESGSPAAALVRMSPSAERLAAALVRRHSSVGMHQRPARDDPFEVAAQLKEANRLFDHGRFGEALKQGEQALERARRTGSPKARGWEGEALALMGSAHYHLRSLDRMLDAFQGSLAIAREVGDFHGVGAALANVGRAYAATGQLESAITSFQEALEISRRIGDSLGEAHALAGLGSSYEDMGLLEDATICFHQATEIARRVGDRTSEITALIGLADVHIERGQMEDATRCYEQVLSIARETKDRRGEGTVLGALGSTLVAVGETERAIDLSLQAIQLCREMGDLRGMNVALANLGRAHSDLGQGERAVEFFSQSVEISRRLGDPEAEVRGLLGLGVAHLLFGRPESAILASHQALDVTREIKDRGGAFLSQLCLGRANEALGRRDEAIASLEAALEIGREMDDAVAIRRATDALARLRVPAPAG